MREKSYLLHTTETDHAAHHNQPAMSSKDDVSDDEYDLESQEISMDEDQVSSDTLEAIATLKDSLKENPGQYEPHTQLIVLLKDAAMLEELRQAREAMSAAFPLTEGNRNAIMTRYCCSSK